MHWPVSKMPNISSAVRESGVLWWASVWLCVCVYLSVCKHIYTETMVRNLPNFLCRLLFTVARSSLLFFWQRWNTLCTSGFIDARFSHAAAFRYICFVAAASSTGLRLCSTCGSWLRPPVLSYTRVCKVFGGGVCDAPLPCIDEVLRTLSDSHRQLSCTDVVNSSPYWTVTWDQGEFSVLAYRNKSQTCPCANTGVIRNVLHCRTRRGRKEHHEAVCSCINVRWTACRHKQH